MWSRMLIVETIARIRREHFPAFLHIAETDCVAGVVGFEL